MKFNKSSGEISKVLLIAAAVVLVLIVIIFFVVRTSQSGNQAEEQINQENNEENIATEETPEPTPQPVYETQIGDIRFILQSSTDLGNILSGSESYQNVVTTERFVRIVVGAQNKGKANTTQFLWDVVNIIDSEGRVFENINNRAYYFLPQPNLCGASLKPEFAPISCTKIYEVSELSRGLKVEIIAGQQKEKALLDLTILQ